jgi:hypothetical protein
MMEGGEDDKEEDDVGYVDDLDNSGNHYRRLMKFGAVLLLKWMAKKWLRRWWVLMLGPAVAGHFNGL